MAKKKVTQVVEELLADFLEQEGYELYHSEFVKEGSDWFLRVYIDFKPENGASPADSNEASSNEAGSDTDAGERYVSTDDCEKVSRFLSEAMDQADPIEQNYYLEVSSPGMDRPLLKAEHWRRYIGRQVEVRLYRGKDGTKNITGTLDSFDDTPKAGGANEADTPAQGDAPAQGGDKADPRVTITDETGKVWELELSEIAKARLAVVF